MRKVIAAINISLDGNCDHTAGIANEETHQHYNDLLESAGVLLYGRITYQLMENYWPGVVEAPTGNKSFDEFAVLIDDIPKVVFSHTLKDVEWKNSRLATKSPEEEIKELKQQEGKPVFIGSPGLISQATNLGLIDEYQICIHPVLAGKGLTLFKDLPERVDLKLVKTKVFECGAVVMYYSKSETRE